MDSLMNNAAHGPMDQLRIEKDLSREELGITIGFDEV